MFIINKTVNTSNCVIYALFMTDNLVSHDELAKCASHYWSHYVNSDKKEPDFTLLSYKENGKPFFTKAPEIHFSISHCKEYWCVAICPEEVGIDCEIPRELSKDLANRFLHENEAKWIKKHKDFFYVWTAKEACVKLTGQGISNTLKGFDVCSKVKYNMDDRIFEGITVLDNKQIKYRHIDITPNVYISLANYVLDKNI